MKFLLGLALLLALLSVTNCTNVDESLDPDATNFDEQVVGTFKLTEFHMAETVSGVTTNYNYSLSHQTSGNYTYLGHTITKVSTDNFSRTVFGKIFLSANGRDTMMLNCDGHLQEYQKNGTLLERVRVVNASCTSDNYTLSNTTTYLDNITATSSDVLIHTILQENGTISRLNTGTWKRQ
jgi:hypothetical protein